MLATAQNYSELETCRVIARLQNLLWTPTLCSSKQCCTRLGNIFQDSSCFSSVWYEITVYVYLEGQNLICFVTPDLKQLLWNRIQSPTIKRGNRKQPCTCSKGSEAQPLRWSWNVTCVVKLSHRSEKETVTKASTGDLLPCFGAVF